MKNMIDDEEDTGRLHRDMFGEQETLEKHDHHKVISRGSLKFYRVETHKWRAPYVDIPIPIHGKPAFTRAKCFGCKQEFNFRTEAVEVGQQKCKECFFTIRFKDERRAKKVMGEDE
jgi:hypothetical protein